MMAIAWALISAEALKVRRTAAIWMVVAAPVLLIFLHLSDLFGRTYLPLSDMGVVWEHLLRNGWSFWMFLVPILVAFEAASLANLEHRGKHLKQLFAYPIPRWSVHATKMLFCALLLGASFLLAALGLVGNVLIFSGLRGHGLSRAIPWSEVLSTTAKAFAASWLTIAIQSWLSARFTGIAAPVGIGFAALILGTILLKPDIPELSSWYPWLLPLRTLATGDLHDTRLPFLLGCVGGVMVGALACWDLARRRDDG